MTEPFDPAGFVPMAAAAVRLSVAPVARAALAAPAASHGPVAQAQPLPLGVRIVAAPWRGDLVPRVAVFAEMLGVLAAPSPAPLPDAA
jgi:hypothetical protein